MNSFHTRPRPGSTQEWVSALGTLLVLSGVYASMDNFATFAENPEKPPPTVNSVSVSPPYWNDRLSFGFRSVVGDRYNTRETPTHDIVSVKNRDALDTHGEIKVSYYKDTPIEVIDTSLPKDIPRAYARLSTGIAVIEGDLNSPRAKTIFSTLHAD